MKMLDDAGIYLALDANTPDYSLNRESNATLHRSYNDVYLQNVFATIDAFHSYNNLLLFFSGNEVINERNNTGAATYIKSVTRDMKRYIGNRSPRKIPLVTLPLMSPRTSSSRPSTLTAALMMSAPISLLSTTTPGATPLTSPSLAGTRRSSFTRTTASLSSSLNTAATSTSATGAKSRPCTPPT